MSTNDGRAEHNGKGSLAGPSGDPPETVGLEFLAMHRPFIDYYFDQVYSPGFISRQSSPADPPATTILRSRLFRLTEISAALSPSTRALFSPTGICIAWDAGKVQLLLPDFTQDTSPSEAHLLQVIAFGNEEILDVAVHDDDLYILSGVPAGNEWRRRLRRRSHWDDDPWTKDHPLYSYGLRFFSLQRSSQVGPALWLADQGVNAVIRAGTNTAIVKLIGPHCYASMWKPPGQSQADWHCFHEELTWDPDLIARELGFQDAEDEITHIRETDDDSSPGVDSGWRNEYTDVEFLDYAFISDTLVLRLRDSGMDDADGWFSAEVLDLSEMKQSPGRQEAPALVASLVRETTIYMEMTKGFINTPLTFSDDDWFSITLISVDGIFQTFFRVSDFSQSGLKDGARIDAPPGIREPTEPFLEYAHKYLGPTFSGRLALLPAVDVDAESATPDVPSVRFVRLPPVGNEVTYLDVPFMSLFVDDSSLIPELPHAAKRDGLGLPSYLISWDGRDTICITYRDNRWQVGPGRRNLSQGWFIRLSHDITDRLRLDPPRQEDSGARPGNVISAVSAPTPSSSVLTDHISSFGIPTAISSDMIDEDILSSHPYLRMTFDPNATLSDWLEISDEEAFFSSGIMSAVPTAMTTTTIARVPTESPITDSPTMVTPLPSPAPPPTTTESAAREYFMGRVGGNNMPCPQTFATATLENCARLTEQFLIPFGPVPQFESYVSCSSSAGKTHSSSEIGARFMDGKGRSGHRDAVHMAWTPIERHPSKDELTHSSSVEMSVLDRLRKYRHGKDARALISTHLVVHSNETMLSSPFPAAAALLPSTRALLSPNGVCIAWDAEKVQLLLPEFTTPASEATIIRTIKFEEEEILDVAKFEPEDNGEGDLNPTMGWMAAQPNVGDCSAWTRDHPLYSYGLCFFSLHRDSQIGSTLWLPDPGVNAIIRAGKKAVIIKSIGPECYASFWNTPGGSDVHWHCFHEELMWDPDLIARELGFRDAAEEMAHIAATNDAPAPNVRSGWRDRYEDIEFMDYAFISNPRALRLRDTGMGDLDGWFSAEVLDLSIMSPSHGRQEARALFSANIHETTVYSGITRGLITAPTSFSTADWAHGAFQAFFTLSDLNNPVMENGKHIVLDHAVPISNDGPFTNYVYRDLGPTFFGRFALLPTVDLEAELEATTSTSNLPSLRFVRFPDPRKEMTQRISGATGSRSRRYGSRHTTLHDYVGWRGYYLHHVWRQKR
ncbi:hypothetical protein DFH09DRAFT_1087401 [Mycena vulgaris]|nr:hypothetical protein DFH09DRAFT_1087401 [Mycena vulgaris]